MKIDRSIFIHGGLLIASVVLALASWSKDDSAGIIDRQAKVTVWKADADQLQRVIYETKQRKIVLTMKRDQYGPYLVGHVTSEITVKTKEGDAGAPKEKKNVTHRTFIAGSAAKKFIERITSLHAFRAVGSLPKDREAEFGFDKPEGTVTVEIAGNRHVLTLGGLTPGGLDRYVRDEQGRVFAVPGGIIRDIRNADSRLMQRELHEWMPEDAYVIVVASSKGKRKFVRFETDNGKMGWANEATPNQRNETVENWLRKVDRLRGIAYVDEKRAKEVEKAVLVASVTYFDKAGKRLGFVELLRQEDKDTKNYFVKSEQSRLPMETLSSTASQVDEDLGSIMR